MSSISRPGGADDALVARILQVGVAGCFIGHGAFGVITKAAWLPYFGVAHIGPGAAWRLMPPIGAMDIAMGCLALLWPCRALLAWATVWAFWTALLRPLSGESGWEFWERAGNYGAPLALLMLAGLRGPQFSRLGATALRVTSGNGSRVDWVLRVSVALLLVGHVGCVLFNPHSTFVHNCATIWRNGPAAMTPLAVATETLLAVLVLLRPAPGLLALIAIWKLATESLFVFAHAPIWEVVERFGSYTLPLALACQLALDRVPARTLQASPAA